MKKKNNSEKNMKSNIKNRVLDSETVLENNTKINILRTKNKIKLLAKRESTVYKVAKIVPLFVLLLACSLIFNIHIIKDDSMNSHLAIGSVIYGDIEPGDVVLIRNDSGNYIRRILGVPGDKVKIDNGTIYINEEKVEEEYYTGKTYSENYLTSLTNDVDRQYFVLADNRTGYSDSRTDKNFAYSSNIKERIIILL